MRFGDKGTHTSRTIMLEEVQSLFAVLPPSAGRPDYAAAIMEENVLGKATASTRKLTNQRLAEMYGLDPRIPLFRVLRHLWEVDREARPQLALLTVLARDPLLRATASPVFAMLPGEDLSRSIVAAAIREVVGERLNDAILDKVVRNGASSWTQSGHLVGRTLKRRRRVVASPTAVAFALYLARTAGFLADESLNTGWLAALDCAHGNARELALDAKRMGLIDLRIAGDVFEVSLDRLDPGTGRG